MDNEIRELKNKLSNAIQANDVRLIRGEIASKFKEIAMTLAAEVHGERDLLNLKLYLQDINCLNTLRRMNSVFEARTRYSYFSLTEAYHFSLFQASLGGLLKNNRKPKFRDVDSIMEDIDFLKREALKVLPKHLHKSVENKSDKAKREILSRLSMVDSLLNRYMKRAAWGDGMILIEKGDILSSNPPTQEYEVVSVRDGYASIKNVVTGKRFRRKIWRGVTGEYEYVLNNKKVEFKPLGK
jgi:hypothetical protein